MRTRKRDASISAVNHSRRTPMPTTTTGDEHAEHRGAEQRHRQHVGREGPQPRRARQARAGERRAAAACTAGPAHALIGAAHVRPRGMQVPGGARRVGVRPTMTRTPGKSTGTRCSVSIGDHDEPVEAAAQRGDVGQLGVVELAGDDDQRGAAAGPAQREQLTPAAIPSGVGLDAGRGGRSAG